jgi:hypothetical protein
MLYPHPLAQTLSARRRLHPFAQPMLKLLILGNRHRAAMAWRSRCALRTQGASVALLRIKFDHFVQHLIHHGTGDVTPIDVQLEHGALRVEGGRDAVLKTPMEHGMAASYDNLAELLPTLATRGPEKGAQA